MKGTVGGRLLIFLGLATIVACEGDRGPAGPQGVAGPTGDSCSVTDNGNGSKVITCEDGTSATIVDGVSVATFSGTVTNSITSNPVAGVTITLDPPIAGVDPVSDASGAYSVQLPVGMYQVTYAADNFESLSNSLTLVAGVAVTKDVALVPTSPVIITATPSAEVSDPTGTVTLTAAVENLSANTVATYQWKQANGPAVTFNDAGDAASTSVTFADLEAYKDMLWEHSGLPDRTGVMPINPFLLEETQATTFQVTVTMSDSNTFTSMVSVHIDLPVAVASGLRNVPINTPVMLHAKDNEGGGYNWTVTGPSGAVTLDSATGRNPIFTPTASGEYAVTETTTDPVVSFSVYAGTYQGAISGIGDDGRPLSADCVGCHKAGGIAPDKFTDWRQTGHAEIFADSLNTNTHYSTSCLTCHTVGFDPLADNGGFDDASGYDDFLDAFTANSDGVHFVAKPDNWTKAITEHGSVARLGNVQCENCHGPNLTDLHYETDGVLDPERITIASEACATCHGEPPRHARYQQWQESGHGSFELAIDEASVEHNAPSAFFAGAGHCGRCHSGQGFLQWIQQPDLNEYVIANGETYSAANVANYTTALKAIGLNEAEVQPQTCTTCHDPHKQGTTSGEPNKSTVRISGSTPMLPAGFRAVGVGRGALCMTCHNTRNGAHNEVNPPTSFSAPHVAAQADTFMGENAYFVEVSERSPHSFISDTCANCHLEREPPPADLSYNTGGTNHTFAASTSICADCHGNAVNGDALAETVLAALHDVEAMAGKAFIQFLDNHVGDSDTPYYVTAFNPETGATAASATELTVVPTGFHFTEFHGQISVGIELAEGDAITDPFGGGGTVTEVYFQLGSLKNAADIALFTPATDVFVAAAWNYFLLESDGSHGAHNPKFVLDVLAATYNELAAWYADLLE